MKTISTHTAKKTKDGNGLRSEPLCVCVKDVLKCFWSYEEIEKVIGITDDKTEM